MYESPIEMYVRDVTTELCRSLNDQYFVRLSQAVDFDIDREKLIKALSYDRFQYERGYRDGLAEHRWISVDDRLPEEAGRYLTTCDFNTGGRYVSIQVWDDGWGDCADCVVAWMPLPEYYTGDLEYWLRKEEE